MNSARLGARSARLGVVVVAALAVGAAGCTATDSNRPPPAATAASSAPAQEAPREALQAAARKLGEDTVKVRMSMGTAMDASGMMDPRNRKVRMAMEVGGTERVKMQIIGIGTDAYLKFEGKAAQAVGSKWLHIDASKLPPGSGLDMMPNGDPAGVNNMVQGLVDVERDGARGFKGTLDLTKSPTIDKNTVKALGPKATAMPFTAQADEQGRLTAMEIDMKSLDPSAGTILVRYSDFGTPVDVEKPAADQVTEAPPALINSLGG